MDNIQLISQQLKMLLKMLDAPSREKAMVSRWHEEIGAYGVRQTNRQKVLDAIRHKYDTMNEIIDETGLPRSTCFKICGRLLSEGAITRTKALLRSGNRSGSTYEFRFAIASKSS